MQSFASAQLAVNIPLRIISQTQANARELSVFTAVVATVFALHDALQSLTHYTMSLVFGHVFRRIMCIDFTIHVLQSDAFIHKLHWTGN